MKNEPWVPAQPFGDLFALVNTQVVTNNMNRGDVIWDQAVEVIQEADEFDLPFASETSPVDLTCPGIESGKEIECAFTEVFVFKEHRFLGFRRFGGLLTCTGLQGGFLIETEHHLMGK